MNIPKFGQHIGIIYGLDNLDNINSFYDSNKNLRLDIIKEDDPERDNKLNYILKVITQFLSFGQNKRINSVYLPSFKTSIFLTDHNGAMRSSFLGSPVNL